MTENKIKKSLLLHSCCAPCSSSVLERLTSDYDITIFFYNPCIMPRAEYEKRLAEQKRLLSLLPFEVELIVGEYDEPHETFLNQAAGLEGEPEGGKRCEKCIAMRLHETARIAKLHGFALFTTTLSVSPHKNSAMLNKILSEAGALYGVAPLLEDFKKNDGYKRSVELSKQYGLYRQNYCGCVF